MQSLLDDHPQLLVYPLEDCILRDFLNTTNRGATLPGIREALQERNAEKVFSGLMTSPKLSMFVQETHPAQQEAAPTKHWNLISGKICAPSIDVSCFREDLVSTLSSVSGPWSIAEVISSWMYNYFRACGIDDLTPYTGWVTKCPNSAHCYSVFRAHFPSCRIIHLVRDPRAFYLSAKTIMHLRYAGRRPAPSLKLMLSRDLSR